MATRWWLVTRKHPPSVGGMERLSWEVTQRLGAVRPLEVIANVRQRLLPWFVLTAATRLAAACVRRRVGLLHLGDPVLAPLAIVARAFGVPTIVTLHGLDIVHPHPLYRAWRAMFLRRFDAYVCISESARVAAVDAGLPPERLHVIGIGVDVRPPPSNDAVRDAATLLFIGRLVRRKGLAWFVGDVLPSVARRYPDVKLVILGDGPERDTVVEAARGGGVERALLWPPRDEAHKAAWLARASVCVMPNVRVAGDMEGFGIVALEAAAAGCPLLASDLEGLKDAVADGESGALVPPGDAAAWIGRVDDVLARPREAQRMSRDARAFVAAGRSWDRVIDAYCALFDAVAARRAPAP